MFVQLARLMQKEEHLVRGGGAVRRAAGEGFGPLALHPRQVADLLETAWLDVQNCAIGVDQDWAVPGVGLPTWCAGGCGTWIDNAPAYFDLIHRQRVPGIRIPCRFDHLIYAYLIENTRIYEVMMRVLSEFVHGERLGVLQDPLAQVWAATTEALFYAPQDPLGISGLVTWVRPDPRASRRNAYWRMFGVPLVHNGPRDEPYPFHRPSASNTAFVSTLEEFMREVWRGIENANNQVGPKSTDDAAIATLAQRLGSMLRDRRQAGTLAREEFVHVATMAWFHLTVMGNSPIVRELRAVADTPEGRLRKMAQHVGLPVPVVAENFFELAPLMSRLLIMIEARAFDITANAPLLYLPGPIRDDMMMIISNWSQATGRDMKARKVVTTSRRPVAVVSAPSGLRAAATLAPV